MRRNARVPARRIRGFTFIEIVVAIAIIAILATVVVPRVIGRVGDARVARAKSDVQALRTALDTFGGVHGLVNIVGVAAPHTWCKAENTTRAIWSEVMASKTWA